MKRYRQNRILIAALLAAAAFTACRKVPGSVIQPEQMAQLMADVHTAEGVIDMNHRLYRTDSSRQALRQSVFMRHGVTPEQVDSSLAWYGRNITFYMDVYDRTIEILEHRLVESGNRVAAAALSIAGDSVDVWSGARLLRINDRIPSRNFAFSYEADQNWEPGDIYTWRAKFFNSGELNRWGIVAEYTNGTIEYQISNVNGDGWHELMFITDSTLTAKRIYGFLAASNRPGFESVLDSVEMVRKRVNPVDYPRHYTQKRILNYLEADSVKPAEE